MKSSLILSLVITCLLAACATVTEPPRRTAAVPIVPRSAWTKTPPHEGMLRDHSHGITGIVIHASDGRNTPGMNEKKRIEDSVLQTHMFDGIDGQKFGDVAYHYFIGPSGTVYAGRAENKVGDTFTKYPLDGQLLICLLGDFRTEAERKRDDSQLTGDGQLPTAAAQATLVKLVREKMAAHNVSAGAVQTHREAAPTQTTCPGDHLQQWFETDGRRQIAAR